ncbi:hypothetical protein QFZ32_000294 [Streptomyces canus]|nr:hypothetical protein [Streptomyces canus]MDQ1064855.1 hypothetical protein [Streptomyces canus]
MPAPNVLEAHDRAQVMCHVREFLDDNSSRNS